jgi:hypothetical protein
VQLNPISPGKLGQVKSDAGPSVHHRCREVRDSGIVVGQSVQAEPTP